MNRSRPTLDVADLDEVVFGPRSLMWWATMGLVAIEGTVFALAIAAYFYLRTRTNDWPPGIQNPDLWAGTANVVLLLLSGFPNMLIKAAAKKRDLARVRLLLLVMSVVPALACVFRGFEFATTHCKWDSNAYGSIVWMLLGLHAVHLITDALDTWVLTALMYIGPLEPKRFMDIAENADYWYFVIAAWIPIYVVIYWAPRWI
jgi:cytochrome c oxidase subunit 3